MTFVRQFHHKKYHEWHKAIFYYQTYHFHLVLNMAQNDDRMEKALQIVCSDGFALNFKAFFCESSHKVILLVIDLI